MNDKVKLFGYFGLTSTLLLGCRYYIKNKVNNDEKKNNSLHNLKNKLSELNNNLNIYHDNLKDINDKLLSISDSIEKTNKRITEIEKNKDENNLSYFSNISKIGTFSDEKNSFINTNKNPLITEF